MGVPNGYTSAQVVQAVPVSSGIVQVKSTTLTTTFSGSATLGTFLAITGLTVTITPTSTSNKILLIANVSASVENVNTNQGVTAILTGGNSASAIAATASARQSAISAANSGFIYATANIPLLYLDSPATTSAITYGVSVNYLGDTATPKTIYVNRTFADSDVNYTSRTSSTITAFEVIP